MSASSAASLPPDANRGPLVLGWIWSTNGLAIIVVFLRLYTRMTTRALGGDDYLIVIATIVTTFGSATNQVMVHDGFGRHVLYVLPNAAQITKWTIIAEVQSYFAVGLIKISVCWFILRMIRGTMETLRIAIIAVMSVMGALTVSAMLVDSLQCFPLRKAWNAEIPGTCISTDVLTRLTEAFGAIGCATDFACVIIPVYLIHKLKMNRRTKTALWVVLSFGIIPGACALGKSITTDFTSSDPTFDFVRVLIFTGVETNFGIFVACLPTLRPLFNRVLNGTTMASHSRPSNQNILNTSGMGYNMTGMNSKTGGTFHMLDDQSEDNKEIQLGEIQMTRTLNAV